MKLRTILIRAGGILLLITALTASTVFAKEERIKITEIDLDFTSNIELGEEGGSVTVRTDSDQIQAVDVEITNKFEREWQGGDVPTVRVTLTADSSSYFSASGKSIFTFTGDEVKYVSASTKENRSELVLNVKFNELESSSADLIIDGLLWDEENGSASWNKNVGADRYQIKLYRGGTFIGSVVTVKDEFCDFSSKITKIGTYTFQVRALDHKSVSGDWQKSPEWVLTKDGYNIFTGAVDKKGFNNVETYQPSKKAGPGTFSDHWQQDGFNWRYQEENGVYTTDTWKIIRGKWYFFNGAGYMMTGWIYSENKWYYCDSTGAMIFNTTTPDGYRIGFDGVMIP